MTVDAQTREIIQTAYDKYLTNKTRWTQGASARNILGEIEYSGHDNAVCWCLSGALSAAIIEINGSWLAEPWSATCHYLEYVLLAPGRPSIEQWNDAEGRTFEDVRELLQKALEA